ncbi:hypothetical protein ACLOJK_018192 [Asimina triloba]
MGADLAARVYLLLARFERLLHAMELGVDGVVAGVGFLLHGTAGSGSWKGDTAIDLLYFRSSADAADEVGMTLPWDGKWVAAVAGDDEMGFWGSHCRR